MSKTLIMTTLVILSALAFAPSAEAQGPDPQCMPVYQEYNVGPVKVVRKNTCSAEVYLFGEPIIR